MRIARRDVSSAERGEGRLKDQAARFLSSSTGMLLPLLMLAGCLLSSQAAQAAAKLQLNVHHINLTYFPKLHSIISILDREGAPVKHVTADAVSVQDGEATLPVAGFVPTSELPSGEQPALLVVLVVDTRPAICKMIDDVKRALEQFLDTLPEGTQAALISFTKTSSAWKAETVAGLTEARDLRNPLARVGIEPVKKIMLWDGVYDAIDLLKTDGEYRTKAVIVLSNFEDAGSTRDDRTCYEHAHDNEVALYFVRIEKGVEKGPRNDLWAYPAEATGGRAFVLRDTGQLDGSLQSITEGLQCQYSIEFVLKDFSPDREKRGLTFRIASSAGEAQKTRMVELPGGNLLHNRAKDLLENGQFRDAIQILDKALELSPENVEVRSTLEAAHEKKTAYVDGKLNEARTFAGGEQYGEARGICREILRVDSEDGRAKELLASLPEAYEDLPEDDIAPPEFPDIILAQLPGPGSEDVSTDITATTAQAPEVTTIPPEEPSPPPVPAIDVEGLVARGDYEGAVKLLASDSSPRARERQAEVYIDWGDTLGPCEATAKYWKAQQADRKSNVWPRLIRSYIQCGNFLLERDPDLAVSKYAKALEIVPDQSAAQAGLARAYTLLGDKHFDTEAYSEALDSYRKALEAAPEDEALPGKLAEAHCREGQRLEEQDLLEEALPHFRKAIEYDPTLYEAHEAMAEVARRSMDYRALIDSLNVLLTTDAAELDREELQVELGKAYAAVQDFEAARDTLYQAVLESSEPMGLLKTYARVLLAERYTALAQLVAGEVSGAEPEWLDEYAGYIVAGESAAACWFLSSQGQIVAAKTQEPGAADILSKQQHEALDYGQTLVLLNTSVDGSESVFISVPWGNGGDSQGALQLLAPGGLPNTVQNALAFLVVDPFNENGWVLMEFFLGLRSLQATIAVLAFLLPDTIALHGLNTVDATLEKLCKNAGVKYAILDTEKQVFVKGFSPSGPLTDGVSRRARRTTRYLEQRTVFPVSSSESLLIHDMAVPIETRPGKHLGVLRLGIVVPDIPGVPL